MSVHISATLFQWFLEVLGHPQEKLVRNIYREYFGYSLEQAQVVGIVGIVGMVGMVGIVGINK